MPIRLSNNQDKLTGNLARAIRYAVNNGARVINMSLTYPPDEEIRQALAYAASRNVITVSAAGNSRDDDPELAKLPLYPARYATDFGISVGAVDSNSFITDFSNLPGTDSRMNHIMAPGYNIYSTVPGNQYAYKPGTSMAAPHVAGVVALMLSANPNLTHAQIRQILTETSTRVA
ncbi:MAG: S8 family serine peptidase [Scytonematopsis contorta HA4267-MV1]|jgi:subtilisin family serine protease|nr:S8 family serine peptidase [Scytonematopsis contorta HA4267-MV1]